MFIRLVNRVVRKCRDWRPVWTPRRLYIPLNSVDIEPPVFFLGTQGGGLTLLSRMLRRNGGFVTIGGGKEFWTGNDEMDKFYVGHECLPDEMALRSPGYNNMSGRENEHPLFGVERSWVYATDELLPEYRMTEVDYSKELEESFKNVIRRSIRAFSERGTKARFLDMSQSYTLKIPLLRSFFSEAKFVLVTRNPYAMCWREVTRSPETKYRHWNRKPSKEQSLRLAAEHWRNSFRIALNDLDGTDDGIVVRFEDALYDPERELRRICTHVGVQFDRNMLPQPYHRLPYGSKAKTKWHPLREGVNKKYLNEIPQEAVKLIGREIGDLGNQLDYHPREN